MQRHADRRKWKRIKTRTLAKMEGKSAILNDVSDTGLCLSTHSLPLNKNVDIVFSYREKTIALKARIQWIKRRYSFQNSLQIGCTLDETTPEYLDFLEQH